MSRRKARLAQIQEARARRVLPADRALEDEKSAPQNQEARMSMKSSAITPAQRKAIKADLLAEVIPWSGTLYHGTELAGMRCILDNGFAVDTSMASIGLPLFSTSKNSAMLEYFGRDEHGVANGFRFKVDFDKVWVISELWYALFYFWSQSGGGDMIVDHLEAHPRDEEKLVALLGENWEKIYDGLVDSFFAEFVPTTIKAIAFPGFFTDKERNSEAEMAITPNGVKLLKKFTDAVIIDYGENSWAYAKEVLDELGVEAGEENFYS